MQDNLFIFFINSASIIVTIIDILVSYSNAPIVIEYLKGISLLTSCSIDIYYSSHHPKFVKYKSYLPYPRRDENDRRYISEKEEAVWYHVDNGLE
jgi:hypothetical protein